MPSPCASVAAARASASGGIGCPDECSPEMRAARAAASLRAVGVSRSSARASQKPAAVALILCDTAHHVRGDRERGREVPTGGETATGRGAYAWWRSRSESSRVPRSRMAARCRPSAATVKKWAKRLSRAAASRMRSSL